MELPNKAQVVNDRIAEIDRSIIELIYEKKKCLEFKGTLQSEAFFSAITTIIETQSANLVETSEAPQYVEGEGDGLVKQQEMMWTYQQSSLIVKP